MINLDSPYVDRLTHEGKTYAFFSLPKIAKQFPKVEHLPFSTRVLLENVLRHQGLGGFSPDMIQAIVNFDPQSTKQPEIAFSPSRVVLQDFTGVPAVVDLAAMRDAMVALGGKASAINPLRPVELVVDHSVQVDRFGTAQAWKENIDIEFHRNQERYRFLKWGQHAFDNFKVVPPDTGIVHQINLEFLARGAMQDKVGSESILYPDTLVGTDSHTTMINGLGILGWGVGGIEAEAAMLGQPISLLLPQVIGFRLSGKLKEGATATDLVLTVTQMLRAKGVVGKFVEFFGEGLSTLTLADRATLSNMAPEYGATAGFFPVDQKTLDYFSLTGRSEDQVSLIDAYMRAQGLFWETTSPEAKYTDVLDLNLSNVEPSVAGPSRPQDRIDLKDLSTSFHESFSDQKTDTTDAAPNQGDVVIAAITSCTNTSNPSVMIAAGLVAKKAREKGLNVKPWVKTSLAPGSKAVTVYLKNAGLLSDLEALGFNVVGYGCTTCIGNSGPLPEHIAKGIQDKGLTVAAVLSGNRNFEGRVHALVKASYLASPPLVVLSALAGNVRSNWMTDPIGQDKNGTDVFMRDLWPTHEEINQAIEKSVTRTAFEETYQDVYTGPEQWRKLEAPSDETYAWDANSTYIAHPPFFEKMGKSPDPIRDIKRARVLLLLGDSITTDHISPAGTIPPNSPAAKYLEDRGVSPKDFNSFGSRRGNHDVMMRGTFGNVRIKNKLVPGSEGGVSVHLPTGENMSVFEAAEKYGADGTPLVVLAGKEYGTGSSRDWAAKGTLLLGVKAVIAESFERIHRSNLIGMGVLPLEFMPDASVQTLGLSGKESFSILGLDQTINAKPFISRPTVNIEAEKEDGSKLNFEATLRLDTPQEAEYFQNGGILNFVLRQLLD